MDDDRELLRSILDGRQGADRVFIDRYRFLIMGVFRRFRQFNREDCEDLFVELFERLWSDDRRLLRNMSRDWKGGSLAGYLRRVARNAAVDRLRQLDRLGEVDLESAPEPIDENPDPVLLGELRRMIGLAMDGLGTKCRDAIRLVHFDDLSYAEAARSLDMKTTNFGVSLMRCRKHLLEIFERDFPPLRLYLSEAL